MSIQLEERRPVPDYAEMDGTAAEMVADTELEAEIEKQAGAAIVSKPDPIPEDPKKPAAIPAGSLTLEQLRFLIEQKLIEEATKAAEQKKVVKPPAKAAPGMVWVFNRSAEPFEWQYNGDVYVLEGYEMAQFMARCARHGKKRSLLSLDPLANKAVFKLALYEVEPIRDQKTGKIVGEKVKDHTFGVPLKFVKRTELIDRSVHSNALGDGRPVKTHPEVIMVDGVKEMMSRRTTDYAELE